MKYLYLDTTSATGIWDWKTRIEDPGQPHMIRLAAALWDHDRDDLVADYCALVRPDYDWPAITREGRERHGIEDAELRLMGMALVNVLSNATRLIAACDAIVMQNSTFHQRMLWRSYHDAKLTMPDLPRTICTMKSAKDAMRSAKWISLAEGYQHYAGEALMLPADPIERGKTVVSAIRCIHLGLFGVLGQRIPLAEHLS